MYRTFYKSVLGTLEIAGSEKGIASVSFCDPSADIAGDALHGTPGCLAGCVQQLDEYFRGVRMEFDLELAPEGTEFQKKV